MFWIGPDWNGRFRRVALGAGRDLVTFNITWAAAFTGAVKCNATQLKVILRIPAKRRSSEKEQRANA